MKRLPEILERERGSLRKISDFIHEHPELGLKEFQACALLKKHLADSLQQLREPHSHRTGTDPGSPMHQHHQRLHR